MAPKIFSGSAGAQLGFVRNAAKENISTASIGVTGKAEYKGFYAQAHAGIGSATFFGAEAGKQFEIKNGFGVKASAGADYTFRNRTRTYFSSVSDVGGNEGPSWKSNDLRAHGNLELTLQKPWGEIGLGVEAGAKRTKQPILTDGTIDPTIGETRGTEYAGTTTKAYVTPTLSSKINLGKNFSLNLDAALDRGNLGVAYNF